MKIVFEIPIEKKAEITKILEADPYGENEPGNDKGKSFSRNGYKLKDGSSIGEDEKKLFLILRGPDEFLPFAKKKLGDLIKECSPEISARIMRKIEDEENSAEQGMGAIFG